MSEQLTGRTFVADLGPLQTRLTYDSARPGSVESERSRAGLVDCAHYQVLERPGCEPG